MVEDVAGFPGYGVDTEGGVWSKRPRNGRGALKEEWRQLSPSPNRDAYLYVVLMKDKVGHIKYVARLVLETFVGPCPAGMEACHGDNNKRNNRLGNLRWDTRAGNHADKERHGTRLIGVKNPRAKLNDTLVADLLRRHFALGENTSSLARRFLVSRPVVTDIIRGTKWKHVPRP